MNNHYINIIFQDVLEGHRPCQTKNAKWLCIRDIYGKLHRPNVYDIGGTYIDNVPDFWFNCRIERCYGLFLMHLFAGNHMEGKHTVGVSTSLVAFDDKDQIVRMKGNFRTFKIDCKQMIQSYITTIDFKGADVEDILKDKTLFIAVQLSNKGNNIERRMEDVLDSIKMNHDNVALLTDPIGSDFIIKSQDGKEFPVHRIVLSIQSEVFRAMLQEDMTESRTGRVTLVDVASEDLQILIEFMYTSTIKVIENINFPTILMLADRYNLVGMRKLCDHILIDQLAADSALDILVLADRYDCSDVKSKALRFIKLNKELFKDARFEQVDSMSLMKELSAVILA